MLQDIIWKYQCLNPKAKTALANFLDELLDKQEEEKVEKSFDMVAYKKNLLEVSVWSEEDLEVFEESRKDFQKWTIPSW